MVKELEKQKRAIWKKHERAFGMPITEELRGYVENELCSGIYDLNQLQDLDALIPDYLKLIAIWFKNNPHWSNGSLRQSETESGENNTKEKSPKWFERRLRLVNLVSAKVISLENLIDRSFTPHKRIQWGPVCNEWNRKYPYDLMTPAVLKVEYYRAIAEADIQREYFNRRYREIELLHRESKKPISDPIVELMARAMPLLRSGGQAAIRIARGLGCLALRQPDIGPLISFFKAYLALPDSDKEEIIKFLETELEAKGGTQ